MPGITIGRVLDAAIAVILMALFNAVVRPVLLALVAPISLILLGSRCSSSRSWRSWSSCRSSPGVHVDGFLTALVGSFVYATINTALTAILGVDSGGSYYGLLVPACWSSAPLRRRTSRAW